MPKIKISDLAKIKEEIKRTTILREGGENKAKVTVHMGTCGIAAGAREVMNTLLEEIDRSKTVDVIVKTTGCAGLCSAEPMITVELPDQAPIRYGEINAEKMKRIFKEHVLGQKIVNEYVLTKGSETTDKAQH